LKLIADGAAELLRRGADELRTREITPKPNHESGLWIQMLEIGTHGVNLPFDGVARHGASGPTLGNHRTQPKVLDGKQRRPRHRGDFRRCHRRRVQRVAVQCEMRRLGNNGAGERGLKLRSRLKPLHEGQTPAQEVLSCKSRRLADLDSQALAALGASGCNHSTAATRLHARQKAVRTGALDFGRLVCTFHDASYVPLSYKLSEKIP
jgi:hypothetical protein